MSEYQYHIILDSMRLSKDSYVKQEPHKVPCMLIKNEYNENTLIRKRHYHRYLNNIEKYIVRALTPSLTLGCWKSPMLNIYWTTASSRWSIASRRIHLFASLLRFGLCITFLIGCPGNFNTLYIIHYMGFRHLRMTF